MLAVSVTRMRRLIRKRSVVRHPPKDFDSFLRDNFPNGKTSCSRDTLVAKEITFASHFRKSICPAEANTDCVATHPTGAYCGALRASLLRIGARYHPDFKALMIAIRKPHKAEESRLLQSLIPAGERWN